MASKDTIKRLKTDLEDILCSDFSYILNKVAAKGLITTREYRNMNSTALRDVGTRTTELVDKLLFKGEERCKEFLQLLQTDDVVETFPCLGKLLPPERPADQDKPKAQRQEQDDRYQLTSSPTGLCVIVNNEQFEKMKKRTGTKKDADSLAEVFGWLGFKVVLCSDQTKSQMDEVLKLLASSSDLRRLQESNVQEWSGGQFIKLQALPQHGDAFVCCILSHGDKGGVFGIDGELLPIGKITSTFDGSNCRDLVNKPKAFFIQACQGLNMQKGIQVCSDGGLQEEDSPALSWYIPVDADVLVAVSSVEGYVAFRHVNDGSWFIQALCSQLKEGCPRGDDIMEILYRVNNDVSQKSASGVAKQMPEAKRVTLRKKLVFSPSSN